MNDFSNGYRQLIALFLAEVIRSRHTTIHRAAEVARAVVHGFEQIHTEEDALRYVTDIEREFEEVGRLRQALHFGNKPFEVSVYEQEIREYAARLFEQDMVTSSEFLQVAAKKHMTIQELCVKYPDFCEYLYRNKEKRELVQYAAG